MATKFSTRTTAKGSHEVVADRPHGNKKGGVSYTVTRMPPKDGAKAREYASELKREARGYKRGGKVR